MQILTEKNQLVLEQKQSGRWQMKHPRYDCDAGDAATNEAQGASDVESRAAAPHCDGSCEEMVTCSLLDPKPS